MKKAIILLHLTGNSNMFQYVVYCMGIFFIVLEFIVLFYILQTMINMGVWIRRLSLFMVAPILQPMQSLVRRSIMNTFSVDLSPYLLLIVLFYLERVCSYLQGL